MSSLDWLKREVSLVKTPKFFAFHSVASNAMGEFQRQFAPLPEDYCEFVREFAQATLFRHQSHPWHTLKVTAPPKLFYERDRTKWFQIGYYLNSGYACFKWREESGFEKWTVFSGDTYPTRKNSVSFEAWLRKTFSLAKGAFSNEEWNAIAAGPADFNEYEKQIVEAISKFSFRKIGVSENGNLLIEVHNHSDFKLPYLTIGVTLGEDRYGSVAIPVGGIAPGEMRIIEREYYKGAADPQQIELFKLPIPDPEDRQYYYEFGIPDWLRKKGIQAI